MRGGWRSLGCALTLALLALLGTTLWVGMRVGMATVWERGRATQDQTTALPGVAWVHHALWGSGHGVVADIDRIDGPTLHVTDRQGEQRVIQVTPDTRLLANTAGPPTRIGDGGLAQFPDLHPGVRIIVLGRPRDDGAIEARLLRVVPADAPADPTRTPSDRRRRETP